MSHVRIFFYKNIFYKKPPFLEYWAKNVGIRRAEGHWIFCGNIDNIFGPEFFNWINTKLRPSNYNNKNEHVFFRFIKF